MKIKYYTIFIIILGLLFSVSCKRTEYTAPDLTGPSVVDFYATMNITQTILPVNSTTKITVNVLSNRGPIEGARVIFILTSYDGSSYSIFGKIYPRSLVTNSNGTVTTTLYSPSNLLIGNYYAKVTAFISNAPYTNNNRHLRVDADVIFSK
jgi:hypothetical protein